MSEKTFRISMGILAVILGMLVFFSIRVPEDKNWDVCFEMVNRNVEWTGAGYNGINDRR